jgi:tetratricopeptide (TPR) repeat protein
MVYLAIGDYGKAIADFSKALLLEPHNPFALFNRGRASFDLCDWPNSLNDLNKFLSIYDPAALQSRMKKTGQYANIIVPVIQALG